MRITEAICLLATEKWLCVYNNVIVVNDDAHLVFKNLVYAFA